MKRMMGVLAGLIWATLLPAQTESIVNTRTDTTQREPRIARDVAGNTVVVWSSRDQAGVGTGNDICLQQFGAGGARTGGEVLGNQAVRGSQEQPAVAMNASGDFVVAWASLTSPADSAFDIKARLFRKGQAPGPEFLVNTTVTNSQSHPSVDMDSSGGFVVAWDSWYQDGGDRGVYARRFGPDGSPAGAEFQVNTTTAYSQARPSVRVRNGGGFVVLWESWKQDGGTPDGYGVYGRIWGTNGTPAGGEFQVNTTINDYQWFADVEVLPDNSLAAVWCSWEQDGSDGTIVLQRLGPDGQKIGGEVIVNQSTEFYQWLPRIRRIPGNRLAVVWSSWKQDGDREGVYMRLFDLTGRPVSYETLVNTTAAGYQWEPDFVASGTDEILAVWASWGQAGKDYEVVMRRAQARSGMGYLSPSGTTHVSGRTTSRLSVQVIDSTLLTGHTYEARFDSVSPRSWLASVTDVTTGDTVLARFPLDRGENIFYLSPAFHGLALQVIPEFDLELNVAGSPFINSSGYTLPFSMNLPTVGSRLLAPIDVAVIWGPTDTTAAGVWTFPLDTAINTSNQRVVTTPFRAWNLTDRTKIDLLVVDAKADLRWNVGEKILLRTPLPYRTALNNTHAELLTSFPAGPLKLPTTGDTVMVLTTRPLSRNDLFRFTAARNAIVGVTERPAVPGAFALSQNYPNPFNPATTIRWQLSGPAHVKLVVFDLLGREVAKLVDEPLDQGVHAVPFDGRMLASGVYVYRLEAGKEVAVKRMVLIR